MSPFRLVAPAGAPVPVRSVLPAFVERAGDAPSLAEFRDRLGVRSLSLVSSGRAALAVLLQAMQE